MSHPHSSVTALVAGLGLALAGAASAADLVVNGDFSAGDTGFTSGYALTTSTPYLFQNGVHRIYAVEAISAIPGSAAYGQWTNVTASPTGGPGFALVADGPGSVAATAAPAWSETVAVLPDTSYVFSFYGAEVSNACCSNAELAASINGAQGVVVSPGGAWSQGVMTWRSGADTTAVLSLADLNPSGPYNDFALTDITFSALVPEPATWALMILGMAMIGAVARRRRAGATLAA